MDANAVGRRYPDGFGNIRLAEQTGVSLDATGDATTLVAQDATKFIVRRITLSNFSAAANGANVGVFTAASGGGTAIAADQTISGATSTAKFVDLTLASAANTDVQTTRVLYVNVSANAAATCDVTLYGDIVSL